MKAVFNTIALFLSVLLLVSMVMPGNAAVGVHSTEGKTATKLSDLARAYSKGGKGSGSGSGHGSGSESGSGKGSGYGGYKKKYYGHH